MIAFIKHSYVSSGLAGALSESGVEAKRIICFVEGWNLFNLSFFLVSFSRWKLRLLSWVLCRSSSASAWWANDALRRLKTLEGWPSGGCGWRGGAGGRPLIAGYPAKCMPCTLFWQMIKLWCRLLKLLRMSLFGSTE